MSTSHPDPGPPGARPTTTRTADGRAGPVADTLGRPAGVPREGLRDRLRAKPGVGPLYRVSVFLAGLLCVVLGLVLSIFPGPLTIPPVLLGLWIWSREFAWAHRLFEGFTHRAREAWEHAKAKPVSSAAVTVGGLALAAVGIWAAQHFDVLQRARDAVGI